MIRLDRVEARYPGQRGTLPVLGPIDLAVAPGEMVVLIGPSGCGKTTLLRLMAGLMPPNAGTVHLADAPLWIGGRRNRRTAPQLGVAFQAPNLFPWYTVEKNIALPLALAGMPKAARAARVRELASLAGIAGFERNWPRELSGGMQQRAAIARALAANPAMLLLDEPFGALDALTRDQMDLELQRIWCATACTAVLVTHSIHEAAFLADRVVVLSARPGQIAAIVPVPFPRPRPLAVQDDPAFHAIVAALRRCLGGG